MRMYIPEYFLWSELFTVGKTVFHLTLATTLCDGCYYSTLKMLKLMFNTDIQQVYTFIKRFKLDSVMHVYLQNPSS